jgi:hypothetical protein
MLVEISKGLASQLAEDRVQSHDLKNKARGEACSTTWNISCRLSQDSQVEDEGRGTYTRNQRNCEASELKEVHIHFALFPHNLIALT